MPERANENLQTRRPKRSRVVGERATGHVLPVRRLMFVCSADWIAVALICDPECGPAVGKGGTFAMIEPVGMKMEFK